MIRPVPKPSFKRRKPKRGKRGRFDEVTRKRIIDRDEGKCRECGQRGTEIHHVIFRAQNGRGVYTNGLLLCHFCHRRLHDNADLANKWVAIFHDEYGADFHHDEWDD